MDITIYSKDNCTFCISAKQLLLNAGLSYTEKKLGEDFTRDHIRTIYPEAKTFPIIVVDGFNIGGYNELRGFLAEQQTVRNDPRKFLTE